MNAKASTIRNHRYRKDLNSVPDSDYSFFWLEREDLPYVKGGHWFMDWGGGWGFFFLWKLMGVGGGRRSEWL